MNMNTPPRNRTKLLILSQIFILFLVLAMPLLVRILSYTSGKVLYTLIAIACVALAIELRRLLQGPE
jgi:hypothetical protein